MDLESIKTRAQAATPGPWVYAPHERIYSNAAQMVWRSSGPGYGTIATTCSSGMTPDPLGAQARDAEFIAHARTDVPQLLGLVEQLMGIITEMSAFDNGSRGWLADKRIEAEALCGF